ncbi:MAG: hypothetical protein AAFX01_08540 [Cyanobacteria bacterium J06638_28]
MTDTQVPVPTSRLPEQGDPHQVAEVYAAQLMDELFAGVENALEGQDDLPAKPVAASVESLPDPNLSEGRLSAPLLSDEPPGVPIHLPRTLITADTSEQPTQVAASKGWRQVWTVNRALLGAAGLTVLATLGLWLYQRQQVPDAAPVATDVPTVEPQAEFLDYLQRSLEVIAQQVGETSSTTAVSTSPGLASVPAVVGSTPLGLPPIGNNVLPGPGNLLTPTNGGGINVIERVYIPYQATPSTAAALPAGTPTASSTVTDTPTALPATVHTLVGILELGDRSAALFEIDGTPQRVYLGERIGGSSWSLVSVSNEEAVIRRNGEVRSIYIGQQF